jgi:hypothetical protein
MAPSIQAPICTGRPQHVAREARRDLDGQRQLAAAHAPVQVGIVGDRRALDEVARARQVQRVVLAQPGLVAVEHGVAQVSTSMLMP